MHGLWSLLLALAFIVGCAYSYKDGAPESVCESMLPTHTKGPQTSAAPYTMTVPSSYNAGQTINGK